MNKTIILIFTLLVIATSCQETIDWEVEESETKLVVEGRVTTELQTHTIKLTKTSSYFNSSAPEGVSGAEVNVTDGSQSFIYEETEEAGVYTSQNEFQGELGKTYELKIDLPTTIGTSRSFSAFSTIKNTMVLDSINVERTFNEDLFGDDGDSIYVVNFSGRDNDPKDEFYLFEIYVNNKLLLDSIDNVILLDDVGINGFEFDEFEVYGTEDEFEKGDIVSLKILSIEEQYSDFIEGIISEIDGQDILGLSGPPANVKGNISNGGLGFFYASQVTSAEAEVME